jgi:MoaA/NifB/PqqE/SkfB family radical SAM enzyme
MNKLVLITGYTCNNNCIFCYDINKRHIKDKSTKVLVKELIEGRKYGADYVDFIGGEPTIRKDIISLIKFAKKIGYKQVAITTNGRRLSNERFAEALIDSGINIIIFSIHGNNDKLHDMQTNVPGSFKQLLRGMENVKRLSTKLKKEVFIGTNTTITKVNQEYLEEIGKFIINRGIRNSEFIFLDPTGGGFNRFEELTPNIREASFHIKKLLDLGIKNKIPHWHIRYFPFCYLEGYEEYISEKRTPFEKEIHLGPEFKNFNVELSRKNIGRVKSKRCKDCIYNNFCEGIWREYAKRRGLEELKPIIKDK